MGIPFKIQFSDREKYFPTSIQEYIKSCHLEDISGNVIKKVGQITKRDLKTAKETDRLGLDKSKRAGFKNNLELAPIYRTINEIVYNGKRFQDHVYLIFYNFNGTSHIHDFDCEFVTVRYDSQKKIKGMFLSQHGDAPFYKEANLKKANGKYIIYAANESHANYPTSGTQTRFFGFGNDISNSRGKLWEPTKLIEIPNDMSDLPEELEYLLFKGKRGYNTNLQFPPYFQTSNNFSLQYPSIEKDSEFLSKRINSNIFIGLGVVSIITFIVMIYNFAAVLISLNAILFTLSVFILNMFSISSRRRHTR